VGDRPFHFRFGPEGELIPAGGPVVLMNGQAAGWQGGGMGSPFFHGRAGQGVSIVLDVVPTQDKGTSGAGESVGGAVSDRGAACFFRRK
jgi:hypothetical protein